MWENIQAREITLTYEIMQSFQSSQEKHWQHWQANLQNNNSNNNNNRYTFITTYSWNTRTTTSCNAFPFPFDFTIYTCLNFRRLLHLRFRGSIYYKPYLNNYWNIMFLFANKLIMCQLLAFNSCMMKNKNYIYSTSFKTNSIETMIKNRNYVANWS